MSIKLELSFDQIALVEKVLQQIYSHEPTLDKKELLFRDVTYKTSDTFTHKFRSLCKKNSLFRNKKHKMVLDYPQAIVLLSYLKHTLPGLTDRYSFVLLNSLYTDLEQKLV